MPIRHYQQAGWSAVAVQYGKDIVDLDRVQSVHLQRHYIFVHLAWILRQFLLSNSVLRTNQLYRASQYALVAGILRIFFVARCGWLPGRYFAETGCPRWKLRFIRICENWALLQAGIVYVSSEADRGFIREEYAIKKNVFVAPNFVDPLVFRPGLRAKKSRKVITVGRLVPEKRIAMAIHAALIAGASELVVVGDGPLKEKLEQEAIALRMKVVFTGRISQRELAEELCSSEAFILCSAVEGHPKVLIEAMSCELACVATAAPGIENHICHGVTGVLANSVDELGVQLRRIFDSEKLRSELGVAGRLSVEGLSRERIFSEEIERVEQSSLAWRSGVAI